MVKACILQNHKSFPDWQIMETSKYNFKNTLFSKIILTLSIIILIFWILSHSIDIYQIAFLGAVFESLWLFMLLGLLIIPILSIVFFIVEKFSFKSLYLYTLIISIITILLMVILSR